MIKLTEKYPLTKKFRKLEELMVSMKIIIEWDGNRILIRDDESGEEAFIYETDAGPSFSFPSIFGTILARD